MSEPTDTTATETPNILDGYLPRPKMARQLNRVERTLERWESARTGPPITYIGRTPYYNIESARAWLASKEQGKRKRRASR